MAILALATVIAYWGVSDNGFVRYDDDDYITGNRYVMEGLSWEGVRWAFASFHSANWHPLTWLSHMLDAELFGNWAGGHHLMSLAIHIASSILLLWFLRFTTGRLWASFFVAALFALHPLHVESVAWAAERKDVLSAFFWFATMLAYAFYVKKRGALRYIWVVMLFAMGLMSKPMLVTLPVVLLMLDYWPLERFQMIVQGFPMRVRGNHVLRLLLEKLPLLFMAGITSVITLKAQSAALAAIESLGFWRRLANATVSYGRYTWAMVWPEGLAVFYPFATTLFYAKLAAAILFLVVGSIAAMYMCRKRKYAAVGWLWYLVTLVPVIGLVQVGWQSHADRYTYVPLIGLFVILSWGLVELVERRPAIRKGVMTAVAGVLLVLMILTMRQVGYWKNELTLFQRAIAATGYNPAMLANLGTVLGERGHPQEGLVALEEALQRMPNNERIITAIGELLSGQERYEEAFGYFARAISLEPRNRQSQIGMATTLLRLGRPAEAEGYCRKAIEFDSGRGDGYHVLGIILGQMGRMDESLTAFVRAAEAKPPIAMARLNIAKIYAERERLDLAIDQCRQSILTEPHYAAYEYLAELLMKAGKPESAELAFREAVKLAPNVASIRFGLGELLVSQGHTTEAIQELEKAAALEPGNSAMQKRLHEVKSAGP